MGGILGDFEKNGFYQGQDFSLGSNYFYQSGRTCNDQSEEDCQGKPAWVYLRDIPSGKIPIFNNVAFTDLTGCELPILSQRGLVPGILEDISDLNPLNIMENIHEDGNVVNDKCKKITYPEGTHIYDSKAKNKSWKMVTKCSPSYKHLKRTTDLTADFQIPGSLPLSSTEHFNSIVNFNIFHTTNFFNHFITIILLIFFLVVITL